MTQTVGTMEPAMRLALDANFGSVKGWRDDLATCARSLGSAPGRVLLMFRPRDARLVHRRADDDTAHGDVPILGFDIAGLADAATGVDTFVAGIDWADVYARYQAAVHEASDPFGATMDDVGNAVLLDVRRAGVFEQADTMIPRARWCDPAKVATWAGELPAQQEVVVYCVYGHEVGRATAMRLRGAGLNARYLRGGIDGWRKAGLPVVTKPAG